MHRPRKEFNECFVIGVCGGSGSGKKTLSNQLFEYYNLRHPGQVNTLHMHGYFNNRQAYRRNLSRATKPKGGNDTEKDIKYIFDLPENINVPGLNMDLAHLHIGGSFGVPRRNFDTGKIETYDSFRPVPIVIIEGISLLYFKTLRNQVDYKIFLDTPADLRKSRRLEKDTWIDEQYYDKYIEPSYRSYIEPYQKYADKVFRGQDTLSPEKIAVLAESIDKRLIFELELTPE